MIWIAIGVFGGIAFLGYFAWAIIKQAEDYNN